MESDGKVWVVLIKWSPIKIGDEMKRKKGKID
jgi:hypothetical protein